MFMRNVGVLSLLVYDMGARTQSFFYFNFWCAFCHLMQSPWMERVTTMNQLTDIRNKSAESLENQFKNKKNKSSLIM